MNTARKPSETSHGTIFPKGRKWRGFWIWDTLDTVQPNQFVLFRKEFDTTVAQECRLHITAETRYRVYLDGERLADGPPKCVPEFKIYDTHELNLGAGRHCLAIVVNYASGVESTLAMRPGLLAEIELSSGELAAATDATWLCLNSGAWRSDTYAFRMNPVFPFQEHFVADRLPQGWNRVGFPAAGWRESVVLLTRSGARRPAGATEPWTKLVPREIAPLQESLHRPTAITCVEECLDLANRMRSEDLSIGLSQPGQPISFSRVEGIEHLVDGGGPAILGSSSIEGEFRYRGRYDPCITIDFGDVETAYIELDLEGAEGAIAEFGYAERLTDGHFNIAIECQFADRIVLREGRQTFLAFQWRSFRYLRLRVRNAATPVTIHSLRARRINYPFTEKGAFESHDERLNRVFQISRKTIHLCAHDSIVDTPWRENAQWLGDVAAVSLGGIYACFGDSALPGKFLRQAAVKRLNSGLLSNLSNSQHLSQVGNIPDYSLWWIMALWEHYLYTGDVRYLHELYPAACGIIQCHAEHFNERGLIEDMPYWAFIDWAAVEVRGESAAYNAIFAGALDAFAKIAQVKQDAVFENLARQMREALASGFADRFWNEESGCLIDAVIDGEPSEQRSEHANFAAILWGLVDREKAERIVQALLLEPCFPFIEAEPFFTSVTLRALARIGRRDLALDVVRDRWAGRMLANGATTTYEEWSENGSWRNGPDSFYPVYRSHSHAWSAFPAEFLTRYLIGLEILEPGCSRVRLAPFLDLDYEAIFPTPLGEIRVRCNEREASTEVPTGIAVR